MKGILDTQTPNSRLGLKGKTPKVPVGATAKSTQHKTSSINNIPEFTKAVSGLDRNGTTPPKYLDNPPV